MQTDPQIIQWLLEGDVSIQFQTHRDLLGEFRPDLQASIEHTGWGARLLSCRHPNGHWGQAFYQPKWISTHYTVLDLKNLGIAPTCAPIRETLDMILKEEKGPDGGLRPIGSTQRSDVCINGMALNYLSYFRMPELEMQSVVDFLLSQHMADGGFNCQLNRKGAHHSSLHSTISVLEGILEYARKGYTYRLAELQEAKRQSEEFILQHRLYKSDKTGAIIDSRMLHLCYPGRWKYDILRALDYFQEAKATFDPRMGDALEVLLHKRKKDGRWNLPAHHPGQLHFEMEQVGQPGRWNTLRALRVFKWMVR